MWWLHGCMRAARPNNIELLLFPPLTPLMDSSFKRVHALAFPLFFAKRKHKGRVQTATRVAFSSPVCAWICRLLKRFGLPWVVSLQCSDRIGKERRGGRVGTGIGASRSRWSDMSYYNSRTHHTLTVFVCAAYFYLRLPLLSSPSLTSSRSPPVFFSLRPLSLPPPSPLRWRSLISHTYYIQASSKKWT